MSDVNVIVKVQPDTNFQAAVDSLVQMGLVVKKLIPVFKMFSGSIDESLLDTCKQIDGILVMRPEEFFHKS